MKHKQLINLFQLQCKIQNPINLKMNRKNLKNFTSQSPITQMFQNFMIFINSSVIFFVVCFLLQSYILIIYRSIKFQKQYLSSWPLIRACFLLRFWWAKFICLYSGHWFLPIYGYRRSFSQIFKNKEANLGGKPYHVCKFTIQNLWLKYEGCHYLVNVPVVTRSWKKVAPKKCKWQIKCVQLWKTLCNNF